MLHTYLLAMLSLALNPMVTALTPATNQLHPLIYLYLPLKRAAGHQ